MKSPSLLDEKRVLFQKLSGHWYVFVDIEGNNEDVFYTRLPDNLDPKVDKYEIFEILEDEMDEEEMELKKAS